MAIFKDRWRDNSYRDEYEREGRDRNRSARDRDRGVWDRTGDEVRSWFGDEEAERRRRHDEARERSGAVRRRAIHERSHLG